MAENTQTIKLEALDTLFFRDGKPFSMGEDSWADGIFPPPPSVIYGALRTAWASENNIPLNEIDEKTKDLVIHKINLQFENNVYYPMPLDLVVEKVTTEVNAQRERTNKYNAHILDKFPENYLTSNPFGQLITYKNENIQIETLENGIIQKTEFMNYLGQNSNDYIIKTIETYLKTESKIGIGRDNFSNNVSDGMLYRVGMKRVINFSFIIELGGLKFLEAGILKLGAEAKTANYQIVPDEFVKAKYNMQKSDLSVSKFKLILSSPAYFEQGSIPSWIDKSTFIGKYNNTSLKLINCIIGKPILQGGFDMKTRKPKPMIKLVPAGSIYFFESETEIKPNELFSGISISDNSESTNFKKQGYGHFNIAKI